MIIFTYDKTFEGLLTALFDAYERKLFPEALYAGNEPLPLFYDQIFQVISDEQKSNRVWKGLEKKLSQAGLSVITANWLSELPGSDMLLFRYMQKAIDSPEHIEYNFGDPDILLATQISKKVSQERLRLIQFTRFRKAADDTFFAVMEPIYNVLPLALPYFQDRFADQKWILYDVKRDYGYYYDLSKTIEVHFEEKLPYLWTGELDDTLMAKDEKLFQRLWQTYFKSIAIKERINPKLHRQHMPARFWKFMPEKK